MADTELEKRRLFIGGLHHELKEEDLKERFGRHGTISSLKLKTKKDTKGNPIKTFAHMDIVLTDKELKKCMSIYNNTKWNGNTMQIQLAKESFLTRLEQERTAVCSLGKEDVVVRPKKPSHQAAAEKRLQENFEKAGVSDFMVKGKVPGTQIEGEKNWIVGKYGRVLPVVYIRRKDKQKVVCYDPSKFSHHLKKFKNDDKVDEGIGMAKVEKLTWDLPESNSEVSLKRKGIFTQARPLMPQRKKVKDDLVMKKDQLAYGKGPECGVPKRGVDSYCSGQSDSDFDEKDDDDRFPTNEDRVQVNSGGAEQPNDFEIVVDSASPFFQKAKSNTSMFESEPGYDSDDRDSVDTDELCTLVRSSKKFSGSQTNGVLKRKEASKTALPTGDKQARIGKMKRVKKAHKEEEESDMCEQSEFVRKNDDEKINVTRIENNFAEVGESGTDSDNDDNNSLNGDDTTDSEQHKHSEEEEEMNDMNNDEDGMDISKQDDNYSIDDGPVPSLNFEPLILDRSHLQGHKNANDLSEYSDDDEQEDEEEDDEDDEEEEEDGDDHNESDTGEVETATQDSDEEDDDQETLGSPIARFDFEPLILDRAAIRESIGTETKGDQPDLECHAEEKKEDSDDSEIDKDNDESDEEDKSSDESSDESSDAGEEHMEEGDNTESDERSDNTLNNIKEMKRSTDKEGKSKALPEVKPSATVIDVKKAPAGLQLKNDKINQDMYDKSGRLLSKAAKKKLAREEAEKQMQANERRLESMKKQQRALLDRQVAIKGALSAVDDKDKKQGKHITFDSDSDDEDPKSDTGAGNDETMIAGQKIQSKISLFESDSDSDDEEGSVTENRVKKMWEDEEDDEEDDERFKIKPQYEGEAGQKLIQMEARYGGDTRFKLDTRFLDKENESAGTGATAEVKENAEDDPSSSDLQEEKRRSLSILQNMLGTPVVASSKPVEPNFKDPSQLHYDPSRDEHSKYELQEADGEESDAKKIEEEVRREKRKMEEERAKLPEVSKEKFFQVSSNLKDAFSGAGGGGLEEDADGDGDGGEGDGGTFTFFGRDDSDGEDEVPQTKMDENVTKGLASSLLTSKRFKYDSSDDDDDDGEDDEGMEVDSEKIKATENVVEEESEDTSVPQAFFFLPDDPRLTAAGSQKFCRPKDRDAMMTIWEEMKAQLQNDFRKRHQKAVRDQKTSKKWQKKPVKSKK